MKYKNMVHRGLRLIGRGCARQRRNFYGSDFYISRLGYFSARRQDPAEIAQNSLINMRVGLPTEFSPMIQEKYHRIWITKLLLDERKRRSTPTQLPSRLP